MRAQQLLPWLTLVASASTPGVAQRLPKQLETLSPHQLVLVRTSRFGMHIGRFTALLGDTLYLEPERGSGSIELAAISDVWVRGTATVKGAIIGGVSGAVVGAAFLALASYGLCDAAVCSVDGTAVIAGLIGGGAFGTISGAVIGAMFGQWHRRYP